MSAKGIVDAVCVSERKGARKVPVESALFVENFGVEGDAHGGEWHRQVSLLAAEDISTIREKGLPDLAPGDFAENVVISGIDLSELGLGSRLRIGSDVLLCSARASSLSASSTRKPRSNAISSRRSTASFTTRSAAAMAEA